MGWDAKFRIKIGEMAKWMRFNKNRVCLITDFPFLLQDLHRYFKC